MNNKQENKRSMYRAVLDLLTANVLIYSSYLPFSDAVARFKAIIEKINEQSGLQTIPIVGVTEDKQRLREFMEGLLVEVCNKITAYAHITNNNTLKEQVAYPFSSLRRQRDTLLLDTAQNVLNIANQNLIELGSYNITGSTITSLQQRISDFNNALTRPRQKIVSRKGATQELLSLFRQADKVLKNELDMLVVDFINTQPEFERNYQNARIIIDLGVRRRSEKDFGEAIVSDTGDNSTV